jgi:cobalt/nickel transport system permease protein
VMLGAAAASIELGLSGTIPLRLVLPAMLGVHALIGIGEALITLGALALVRRARPELLKVVSG